MNVGEGGAEIKAGNFCFKAVCRIMPILNPYAEWLDSINYILITTARIGQVRGVCALGNSLSRSCDPRSAYMQELDVHHAKFISNLCILCSSGIHAIPGCLKYLWRSHRFTFRPLWKVLLRRIEFKFCARFCVELFGILPASGDYGFSVCT